MKKKAIAWSVVGLVALVIVVGVIIRATAWQRNFEITYIGSSDWSCIVEGSTKYQYTLRNKTNRTFRNIKIVYTCRNRITGTKWKYVKSILGDIQPGETIEFNAYRHVFEKYSPTGSVMFMDYEISNIRYN